MIINRFRSAHGLVPMIMVLCFLVAVLIGVALSPAYGMSWDEPGDAAYGSDALAAYVGSPYFTQHGDRMYYGPLFFMFSDVSSRVLGWVGGWAPDVGRHFSNYMAFLLATLSVFLLARRFAGDLSAGVAALLFFTQPLLFGHAFINQKDVPFMALFAATVWTGIKTADVMSSGASRSFESHPAPVKAQPRESLMWWEKGKLASIVFAALALAVVVDLAARGFIHGVLVRILSSAYHGQAIGPMEWAFRAIAGDAYKTPLELYVGKLDMVYSWLRVPLASALTALAGWWLASEFPAAKQWLQTRRRLFLWSALTGALVGATTSVRVAGPLAGVLISLYWLVKARRASFLPLIIAWASACVVAYLTWPFLWGDALHNFLAATRVMAEFRPMSVLFDGHLLLSTGLPWDYLPRLIIYQLTEPALGLLSLGVATAMVLALKRKLPVPSLALILAWFLGPFLWVVVLHTPVYNGFRQLLFILPPLFVLAAVGFDQMIRWIRYRLVAVGLAMALVLPGLFGIVSLHPFEYVYYNSLAGGVRGASGRYELDYWCTAYKQAMQVLNQSAEEGATVAVSGPAMLARYYARPDLRIFSDYQDVQNPDYAISCDVAAEQDHFHQEMPTVASITRHGAVLALIKRKTTGP